eukprot:CAMPEP_0174282500 /NCGR_PEP_ID=MMETSP0809-20121228/3020_1 /TAXON_ID=73025 ORGANISM="Eutreptiella gymnastica-like, Strain CCMP1594" /NCGR_SAMPLE_ID=MMETSP0809 /ASSEMBLY_ACC=CAM_ASM_000658 /LENGTH=52 /DNA_ID=CAMNT_0015376753 /DNA_START=788 /DNA_END=946 /DNA_ORIENTATION=+
MTSTAAAGSAVGHRWANKTEGGGSRRTPNGWPDALPLSDAPWPSGGAAAKER